MEINLIDLFPLDKYEHLYTRDIEEDYAIKTESRYDRHIAARIKTLNCDLCYRYAFAMLQAYTDHLDP